MNEILKSVERVIGLDSHPDSFTAAILRGPTPAAALVEKTFNKVPLAQLQNWAKKHTSAQDLFVLEASGNSFQVVRSLAAVERQAKVLESCHLGKLKEAHATKRTTQLSARLRSYLSDNGVRLKKATRLTKVGEVEEQIRKARSWSVRQWQVIQILLCELRHADQQRQQWRSLIAQEVLADPDLASIVRLCGVREMVAFALGAFIGDIKRFAHPKKLVKYVGLNPAFDDSGASEWSGGIGGHGNKHLRCLLIEGAHAILRCSKTPLAQWGKKLLARKGQINLVVAAMARKLTVAAWYLMMGRWTPLEEIDDRLCVKVAKIIGQVGLDALKTSGKTRKSLREKVFVMLKNIRVPVPASNAKSASEQKTVPEVIVEVLRPRQFTPKPRTNSLAAEYGLR